MPYSMIQPVAIGVATAVAMMDCSNDYTESDTSRLPYEPYQETSETSPPALMNPSDHRQLGKRSSLPSPPASSSSMPSRTTNDGGGELQNNNNNNNSDGTPPTQSPQSMNGKRHPKAAKKIARSMSMKTIFGRDNNVRGVHFKKTSSLADKEDGDDEDDGSKDDAGASPFGFVNGDFGTGKVVDLDLPAGCFVMAYHPEASLLAVGLLNGEGLVIYETRTYTVVVTVERDDAVSAISWLQVKDGMKSYENFSLLAVGCLDGTVALYRMKPSELELQGAPDLVYEFKVNAQVRTMNLAQYGAFNKEVLLSVGDISGVLTFGRFDVASCSPLETKTAHVFDSGILGVATNTSGTLLAACTKGGEVSVCRIQQNNDTLSLGFEVYCTQRNGAVRSIAFSQDEKRLVFGGYDKTVVMVDTGIWGIVRSLKLDGTINFIAFDSLDRYMAVGTRDKCFTLYDTSTCVPVKAVHTSGWVTCISWGKADDFNDIVAIRSERSCISVLDLTPIQMTKHKLPAYSASNSSLSWSRSGRYLARINGSRLIVSDAFRDFADTCEADLGGELKCATFCEAKGKQDLIATVGLDGHLHIIRLHIASSRLTLDIIEKKHLDDSLWVVAWSSDGSFIATGGRGKKLHILDTSTWKQKQKPLPIEGRVWSIAFESKAESTSPIHGLAVGSGDYVTTLFDTDTFQPTLKVLRPRTVRCVVYHPILPLLAVGDGGNIVSLINYKEEMTLNEIKVSGRVNTLAFSPQGDMLAVGTDDGKFTLHETNSWKVTQEVSVTGFAMSASFSKSGKHLALGSSGGEYFVMQLGPFLSIGLVPLTTSSGINQLPSWALHEVLYRSSNGPSLVQRYMLNGSQDSLRRAAALMDSNPDTIYCFDRSNGDSCFDTALKINKPNLLKLVLITLVNGTLESNGDSRRTILTSGMPELGTQTLKDMINNSPAEYVVGILSDMNYVKVPFTEAHEVVGTKSMECGHSTYSDPWNERPSRRLERTSNEKELSSTLEEGLIFRTPAVLPLPGLGTLDFLSALLYRTPATSFDNVAMGLVLRVLWKDYIRNYFLCDLTVFLVYFSLWVYLADWTSATTSSNEAHFRGIRLLLPLSVLGLNTLFTVKEVFQSGFGRRLSYFTSTWNIADLLSIVFVYTYTITAIVHKGGGNGDVPLAVVTTLLLTIKLLSYLRGFDNTGWLISVLVQNFRDVRGFMVVLLAILSGFTASFRLLLGDVAGACSLELDGQSEIQQSCDPDPFDSMARSLLSTFELTILGSYDQGLFNASQHSVLTIIIFVVAVLCVFVVALNALIAVLSDSYARVQQNAVANRRKEKAELIVEYLSVLPTMKLRRIEHETKYFHALLEADEDGDLLVNKDDWAGGLNSLKKDLEELTEVSRDINRQALEELRIEINDDISYLRRDVIGRLENIMEEMRQMREIQQHGGVTINGRNVAKAVNVVKSLGQKGFWNKNQQG